MTVREFHEATRPKVKGTWNLHITSIEMGLSLDFFTLLSSISGIIGQKGQANYAAANVFLDSFAGYRHKLGLAACSIDLGVIEDVGYVHERQDLAGLLDRQGLGGISEALLHEIVKMSIIQQMSIIGAQSPAQLITGIAIPQERDSELLRDSRFAGLCFGKAAQQNPDDKDHSGAVHAFLAAVKGKADHTTLLEGAVGLINKQFTKILGLSEPMEPAKPLSVYGLDSLSAVELRNWVRLELSADITTLDILEATSLFVVCEKIVTKVKQV